MQRNEKKETEFTNVKSEARLRCQPRKLIAANVDMSIGVPVKLFTARRRSICCNGLLSKFRKKVLQKVSISAFFDGTND